MPSAVRASALSHEGTVVDRFYDWQDALDDGSCTRECGAARNDICHCRCRGLHHNAGHDYWARLPRETLTVSRDGRTTVHWVNSHAPADGPKLTIYEGREAA